MGRIVVTEFVSLDGVMEDPGGSEGHKHGGWALAISRGDEGDRFKLDELVEAEAQLLGDRNWYLPAWLEWLRLETEPPEPAPQAAPLISA